MARIKTDRVRGGALRVLNDGLIGRSKKLLKRIEPVWPRRVGVAK
ncbi:hypothetical protein QVH35_03275 [Candidatus Nitrosotenuis chungbukensis]|nr:hypothetical protein [Candidatus Nitrosotenuis chungbukensis]WKT58442.1 hypothetical protein QVH35_03275 [Candidatus Nitrosotenuis chungbukensis]